MSRDERRTIRDLMDGLFRHGRLVLWLPVLAMTLALAIVLARGTSYVSTARFLVESSPPNGAVRSAGLLPTSDPDRSDRNLHNELRLIESVTLPPDRVEDLAELVVQAEAKGGPAIRALLNRLHGRRSTDELEHAFREAISVRILPGSDVIEARFAWNDPYVAFALGDRFVRTYTERRKRVAADLSAGAPAGLRGPADVATEREVLIRERSETDQARLQLAAEQASLSIKREHVDAVRAAPGRWIETPELGQGVSDLTRLDQMYFELAAERERLNQVYQPDARIVTDLEQRIEALRAQKLQSVTAILDLRSAEIAHEIAALDARVERIEGRLAELTRPEVELAAAGAASLPRAVIAAYPRIPRSPALADTLRFVLTTGLIALGAALLLAWLRERLDGRMRDAADLERALGAPVLATIPIRER